MTSKTGRLVRHRPAGPALTFGYNPEQVAVAPAVGGWQAKQHPRGNDTAEWQSRPLKSVTFTLLLQATKLDAAKRVVPNRLGSVEPQFTTLVGWGQPLAPLDEPPVLRLDYGPAETGLYVLQQLTPTGVERRRASDLARWLLEVDVELLEWRETTVLLTPAKRVAAATPDAGGAEAVRPDLHVRAGDTLQGDRGAGCSARPAGWQEIAKLNGIRDPRTLRVGQVLRLP